MSNATDTTTRVARESVSNVEVVMVGSSEGGDVGDERVGVAGGFREREGYRLDWKRGKGYGAVDLVGYAHI